MRSRRAALMVTAVGLLFFGSLPPGAVSANPSDGLQYPNLIPLSPFDVQIGGADGTPYWWDGRQYHYTVPALRFSMAVMNDGEWTLDLLGVPRDAGTESGDAYQCVDWLTLQLCNEREEIGELVWHPDHNHFHFNDFAAYELRTLDEDGNPDWSPDGLAAGGQKVSFCLMDSRREREPTGDPTQDLHNPLYNFCTSYMQGISPGSADVYGHYLEGQQIRTDGVADGAYALVVRVDPLRLIRQTSHDDDTTHVLLELSDQGRKVRVL